MELTIESLGTEEIGSAIPSAPHVLNRPVDLVHLTRYTMSDRTIEREVLSLFRTQSQALLRRLLSCPDQASRRRTAHTLRQSARSIGAWRVALAAERADSTQGREKLSRRIDEADAFIAALLDRS